MQTDTSSGIDQTAAQEPATDNTKTPTGNIFEAVKRAVETSSPQLQNTLFDESLKHAQEGRLGAARERLTIMTTLWPKDADARALLAKVLFNGMKYTEALATLEEAGSRGLPVDTTLQEQINEKLRAERNSDSERSKLSVARDKSELSSLRTEVKKLRVENAKLNGFCHEKDRETQKWAWTTMVVASLAFCFVLSTLLWPSDSTEATTTAVISEDPTTPVVVASADEQRPSAQQTETPSSASAQAVDSTDRITSILNNISGVAAGSLTGIITGDTVTLSGEVVKGAQLDAAEARLLSIKGIKIVNTDAVTITARTAGAVHIVQSGDNFWQIARDYYGEHGHAKLLTKANGGSKKLNLGQQLKVPALPN